MELLKIDPAEKLVFTKHGNDPSKQSCNTLRLTNNNSRAVAYKVKTTAPKAYIVKPSQGMLKKGESCNVQIFLQASVPPENQATTRDRFLVQAVDLGDSEEAPDKEQWKTFRNVQEAKMSVQLNEGAPETTSTPQKADLYGSGIGSASASSVSNDLPHRYEEMQKYNKDLDKQINRLKAEIADAKAKANSGVAADGGYGIHHIIIVALIAFVLSIIGQRLGTSPGKVAGA